jgi:leader peptidase (prepilin peptidase)/N-methyltransferase
METISYFFIILIGLELGSFANVCIYRWPRNASILRPHRSHCPWCNAQIVWFDNIPVISYLFLRGKCRHCKCTISVRYPIIELIVPTLWLSFVLPFPFILKNPVFLTLLGTATLMIVITTLTDIDWKIIPDEATFSLAVIGIALSAWNPLLGEEPSFRLLMSAAGLLTGGGVLFLISIFGRLIFKREAMGGGGVKLLAALGTILGYKGILLTFFIGSIVGGLVVLPLLLLGRIKRHSYLPFGPFLNIGAIITLFSLLKKLS